MVSLHPPSSSSNQDIKKNKVKQKRYNKLLKYIPIINKYNGIECYGIIKARSNVYKNNNVFYVQPLLDELDSLVGIATTDNDNDDNFINNNINELKTGDKVLIRMNGIDPIRGQLSFILL